jgi:hypothetical protein
MCGMTTASCCVRFVNRTPLRNGSFWYMPNAYTPSYVMCDGRAEPNCWMSMPLFDGPASCEPIISSSSVTCRGSRISTITPSAGPRHSSFVPQPLPPTENRWPVIFSVCWMT